MVPKDSPRAKARSRFECLALFGRRLSYWLNVAFHAARASDMRRG